MAAECGKLIDQQLAGLNEHFQKYVRKERALQDTERALREQIKSAFDFCLTGTYLVVRGRAQIIRARRKLRHVLFVGEEVANLDAQLSRTLLGLTQAAAAKKNITEAIQEVKSYRGRLHAE